MTELAATVVRSLRQRLQPSEFSALGEAEQPWFDVSLAPADRLRALQQAVEDVAKHVSNDMVRKHKPILDRYYISWYLARNHPESFVPLMIDRLQNDERPRIRARTVRRRLRQL